MSKAKTTRRRISVLGLLKFIAAIGIFYYHTFPDVDDRWSQLFVLVEFFLFVSGFFLLTSLENRKDAMSPFRYALKKYQELFFIIVSVTIFCYLPIVIRGVSSGGISSVKRELVHVFTDITMLNSIVNTSRNFPLWYISAYFIVMPLCYAIFSKRGRFLDMMPLLVIWVLIYYSTIYNSDITFGAMALLRIFTGIMTGGIIYLITQHVNKITLSKKAKIMMLSVEALSAMMSILLMSYSKNSANENNLSFYAVLFIVIFLSIFLSRVSMLARHRSRLFDYLEQLSTVIYLCHALVLLYYWDNNIEITHGKFCFIMLPSVVAISIVLKEFNSTILNAVANKNRVVDRSK